MGREVRSCKKCYIELEGVTGWWDMEREEWSRIIDRYKADGFQMLM